MRTIGRYRILDSIARGGGGEVFHALDPDSGLEVALKVLHGRGTTKARRLEREASSLLRLEHPNVVRVLDVGEHEGALFLTMELLDESLEARLRRSGPLRPSQAAALIRKLALALAYAHRCGLLHRDLKPSNVLFGPDGEPKLADFGLAREVDASQSRLTQSGMFLGTPGYWAPEQAQGRRADQGPHTDVYGLGATLFAVLTGSPPFEPDSLPQAMAQSLLVAPAPSTLNPAVDPDLDAIVAACLALEPGERYVDGDALARALGAYLAGSPAEARPRRARWIVASVGVLGLAAGVGAFVLSRGDPARLPPEGSTPLSETPLERAELLLAGGEFEAVLARLEDDVSPASATLRGEALVWLERNAEAERLLAPLADPGPRALAALGAAQLKLHRLSDGWETLRAVPEGDQESAIYAYGLARASLQHNLAELGLGAIARARQRYPLLDAIVELEVDLLLEDSRSWEALDEARAWVGRTPRSVRARLLLLQVLDELGRTGEAEGVLDDALRDFPTDPRVQVNLAVRELQGGDSEAAVRRMRELAEANPRDSDIQVRFGKLLLGQGLHEQGMAALDRALAIEPGMPQALWQQAMALDGHEGTERSLPAVLAAVEHDFRLSRRVVNTVKRMREGGVEEAAVDDVVEALLRIAPRRGGALVRLGRALLHNGEPGWAVEAFLRAEPEEPVLAGRGLAMAYLAQGQSELAREALERLEQVPAGPLKDVVLAHVYNELGRVDEALELLERSQHEALPTSEESFRMSLLLTARRADLALPIVERLYTLYPQRPQAHLMLARVRARYAYQLSTAGRSAEAPPLLRDAETLLTAALERGVSMELRQAMQGLRDQVRERLRRLD